MSNIIRSYIRNILLETRSTLPYSVVLKEWINVASEFGESIEYSTISGPRGVADQALLIIKDQTASAKVFDNLTTEVQEWILKRWRTKEYFQAMIEGVAIGLVKEYDEQSTVGLKWGEANKFRRRKIHGTKLNTASFNGYLTAKDSQYIEGLVDTFYKEWKAGNQNRLKWKSRMLIELEKGWRNQIHTSNLVHEFHHWVQTGILYMHSSDMLVRKGDKEEDRSNPNLRPAPEIVMNMLKASLTCIDWNDTLEMRGLKGYKVIDQQKLVSLIEDRNALDPVHVVTSAMDEQTAKDFLINSVARQGLRIGNKLTDKMAEQIWRKTFDTFEQTFQYRPIQGWTFIKQIRNVLPLKMEYFKALSMIPIFVMPETDFEKEGKVYTNTPKPGKKPEKAESDSSWRKTRYIWFSKGAQNVLLKRKSQLEYIRERNPREDQASWKSLQWEDKWAEFDAELANFMNGMVRKLLTEVAPECRTLMKSDAKELSKNIGDRVYSLLLGRKMGATLRIPRNEEQLKKMAERITDRLIETTEEYGYDYWLNNVAHPSEKNASATVDEFYKWVTNKEFKAIKCKFYFAWIYKKASGENV